MKGEKPYHSWIPNDVAQRLVFKPSKDATPPLLDKITPIPQICEDCGNTVLDRRTVTTKRITPYPHWRTHCKTCQLYKCPLSGKFEIEKPQVEKHFRTIILDIDK